MPNNTIILFPRFLACSKGGMWKKALALFDEMEEKGIEPTEGTYSVTISALGNGLQWKRALQLLKLVSCADSFYTLQIWSFSGLYISYHWMVHLGGIRQFVNSDAKKAHECQSYHVQCCHNSIGQIRKKVFERLCQTLYHQTTGTRRTLAESNGFARSNKAGWHGTGWVLLLFRH